jgi:predicted nucleotidyltransferase
MTTMAKTWRQLPPRRGAVASLKSARPKVWEERLHFDCDRVARNQSPRLAAITEKVQERARDAGALAVILSGSTARGRRTWVSDLDYHVIGTASVEIGDLREDIDLYADPADRFWAKLRSGDDFAHWSVWYGCVLFDTGIVREAAQWIADHDAWPDPERKLRQAETALTFAEQMAASGDYGATLEQVRGSLSLVARWLLLSREVFPLARDELSGQLEQLGYAELGRALHRSIHERPADDYLGEALLHARSILEEKSSAGPIAA